MYFVAIEGLQLDTLDEDRLKKIRDLEAYERPQRKEIEPEMQRPVFLTPLNKYCSYFHRLEHVSKCVANV